MEAQISMYMYNKTLANGKFIVDFLVQANYNGHTELVKSLTFHLKRTMHFKCLLVG
jgi:hypothetical protein